MKIITAKDSDLPTVKQIFKEYQDALNVSCCFSHFEQELANLSTIYAPPAGGIFLAVEDEKTVACVAFRPISENNKNSLSPQIAELKRLYVHDDYKGTGLGKKLFLHVMAVVKSNGYKAIVLETMDSMERATAMYLKYGFKPSKDYSNNSNNDVKFYRFDFI